MEFPPEIVALIREYSMLHFKYFREYKRVLCLKGVSEWPALREGLQKDPRVLPALLAFETASHVFEPVKSFHVEDPYEWYHAELDLDFYHKQTNLMYCETELSRLI